MKNIPSLFSRNRTPSILDSLQAQSLLGLEGFAEGLRHLVSEKQQIRTVPKGNDS